MATFDDKIDETEPQGDEAANTIDDLFRELKRALVERIAVEHFDVSFNGTSGTSSSATNAQFRHIAGMVGAIGYGTHADMAGLAATYGENPGVGAFFITSDGSGAPNNYPAGTLYRYSGGWQKIEWYNGIIYATNAEATAGTREDVSINPKQLIDNILLAKTDTEYIAVNGGTDDLSKSAADSYTYNIADFTDIAGDIDTAEIRQVHIEVGVNSSSAITTGVTVDMPDGTTVNLANFVGVNSDDDLINTYMQTVPINPGQLTLELEIFGIAASYTIVGVTQRIIEV